MLTTHSSRVKWAKVIFPLVAVGAVIAVMSTNWGNDAKIVGEFVEEDKNFQENSATVERPKLDITTVEGDNYKLEASSIESLDGDIQRFSGGDVKGDLILDDSHWAVQAETGIADSEGETVEFINDVRGVIDNEYTFLTDYMKAEIETQTVTGDKRVEVSGKSGHVEADSFMISGKKTERIITLTGNVTGQINVESKQ